MPDPRPVIPLSYAEPAVNVGAGWRRGARICCAIAWVALAAGLAGVLVKVESVLASGPAVALAGTGMMLAGWRGRWLAAVILGAAHCAFCALLVALVNVLSWSPSDADLPFRWMGAIYTLGMLGPSLLLIGRWRGAFARENMP